MKASLLRNNRQRGKFCTKVNKIIGCRDAHMCSIVCPFWIAYHVQYLMDNKNHPLGEAIRQTFRESIDEMDARKILREAVDGIRHGKREYPPKEWEDKV